MFFDSYTISPAMVSKDGLTSSGSCVTLNPNSNSVTDGHDITNVPPCDPSNNAYQIWDIQKIAL